MTNEFHATKKQSDILESLMFWEQETAYNTGNLEEYRRDKKNVQYSIELCSAYNIPHWVVLKALRYSGHWRKYCTTCHRTELEKLGVFTKIDN